MIISTLNEWLNEWVGQEFLEPTEENLIKFNLDPNKVTINPDGSIDYNGDVKIIQKMLSTIPFKFNEVTGDFNCSFNRLLNLKGSPISVSGNFYCYHNQLVNLVGSPKTVGEDFKCHNNQLISLAGSPESVGGKFNYFHGLILYSPVKYEKTFAINREWTIQDSSGDWKTYSGKDHLKMAFERLDELSLPEVLGIEEGLKQIKLAKPLRAFCQEKIERYLEKNSFRKTLKNLDKDITDMF